MATLYITNADNEVFATVNGLVVYDRKTENNPTFSDQVDLTPHLADGLNTLVVAGVNWGGPATFKGTVVVGKIETPFAFTAPSTPNGIVFHQTFVIPQ
ncbi:hypothetical protein BTI_3779 [Burkholderia thailandensis MSMB121]|uniref:hypothetical protein n=1 Tax=Burkholderia humptydooensis TaxID=430531 RepID=UPI000327F2E1|nr:hypothetical protein [Burkholderia humptydooensis]AGK49587.1 hypothetical protein BTI_3779 [Burkholderia thailandensis MSMB121]ATF32603.1 hypothetical protein CO709_03805 [Burkholderia thailandensis]KST71210.1 hypothetical protein WS76_21775 [Burkholderia humptydooensis]